MKNLYKNFFFSKYSEPLKRTEKSYENQYMQDMIRKKMQATIFSKKVVK